METAPFTEPDQAAALPYRVRRTGIEVLLVTSRRQGRWILPKGNVGGSENARLAAQREAFEEAGVVGLVGRTPVGRSPHGDADGAPLVEVYLLRVERALATWPEGGMRRRQWMSLPAARRRVGVPALRDVLAEAARQLDAAPPAAEPAPVEEATA